MQAPDTWEQPSAATASVRQVALGDQVTLRPGGDIAVTDTILSLTFNNVTSDSRCPTDVQCITAGEATINLTATLEDQPEPLVIVVTPVGPVTVTVGAFEVTLLELTPAPLSTAVIGPNEYRIRLRVERDPFQGVLVPAPIESVQINVAESFPPQYFAQITSIRPNGCASFDHFTSSQDNETVTIRIWNNAPAPAAGIACIDVLGFDEHNINLGIQFVSGTSYTVIVNDVVETFVAQ
ncbi:MAG TPA: hypothetical protein QGF05_01475 [Dehalococcoidia bacterium]|nr:hypothetical protein [Dehalococcoidia bacterium]